MKISNRFDATNLLIDFYRLRRLIVAALAYSLHIKIIIKYSGTGTDVECLKCAVVKQ